MIFFGGEHIKKTQKGKIKIFLRSREIRTSRTKDRWHKKGRGILVENQHSCLDPHFLFHLFDFNLVN